jgi:hypothetical protein
MSDKEYNVTTNCISTNLSETPNLPPSFRENVNRTKESIRLLADKVNLSNHLLLSRTVVVMTVDVQYALLELRNGPDAESPLAELAVSILKNSVAVLTGDMHFFYCCYGKYIPKYTISHHVIINIYYCLFLLAIQLFFYTLFFSLLQ